MCKLSIFVISNEGKLMPYIPLKIENGDANQILGLIQSDHAGYASFQFVKKYFLVDQIKPTWSLEDIDIIRNLVDNALQEPLDEDQQISFGNDSWFNISKKIADIYLKGYPLSFFQALSSFGIPDEAGFQKWYPQSFFQEFTNQYLELSQPRYLPLSIKISVLSSSDTTTDQSIEIDPNTDKIIVTITALNNIVEAAPNTFPSYYPNPDTIDRTVSPNSFSNKTTLTIGQDGCEELMHNALAERKFFFKEIVVGDRIAWEKDGVVDNIRISKLVTFGSSWYPLGHALGEIVYSLPLAPAEQVNIAVIDWKREDSAQRSDSNLYTEQLNHNQQRDRMIEETVTAALRERQSSQSSTIGGSVGVSAFGIGASVSAAHSWSDSEGSRNTEANSLQNLSDGFQQASSNVRSMYSTVVVQTAQSEKATAQTRTVRNYNHSHALTVLYYEVLRQYRIENEISNSEDLLMIKFTSFITDNLKNFNYVIKKIALNTELFRTYESLLEPDLVYNDTDVPIDLNQNDLAGFNVTIKSKRIDDPSDPDPRFPIYQSNYGIIYFLIETLEGTTFAKKMESFLNLQNSDYKNEIEIELGYYIENKNWLQFDIINKNKASEWVVTNEVIPSIDQIKSIGIFSAFHLGKSERKAFGSDIIEPPKEISFRDSFWDGSPKIEWHLKAISVNALIGNSALQKELLNAKGEGDAPLFVFTKERKISYYITTNIAKPTESDSPPAVQQKIVDKVKSRHKVEESLRLHIEENQDYYRRKVVENLGPDYFAKILELIPISGSANITLFDLVNPKPIEMIGEYVIFKFYPKPEVAAFKKGLQLALLNEKSEAYISLPTRGVFAETKLSHCNASEKIDETRFWKWEEHPIPDLAPQIAPVSTDSRNQTPNLTPTQMPNSNLTIVNPPAAPDPTGLTSSLNLLGSLGAFNLVQGDQQNVNAAIQGNLNNVRRFAELNAQLEMQRRAQQQVDQNLRRNREAFERGDVTNDELQTLNNRALGGAIDGNTGFLTSDGERESPLFNNADVSNATRGITNGGGRISVRDAQGSQIEIERPIPNNDAQFQIMNATLVAPEGAIVDADSLNRDRLTEARMYSYLSQDVYSDTPSSVIPAVWRRLVSDDDLTSLNLSNAALVDAQSGFYAALYFSSSRNEYALAFRGSQERSDWVTNVEEARTLYSRQHELAMNAGYQVRRALRAQGDSSGLTFVGHSLGGGLASVCAILYGARTFTFNSAGIHREIMFSRDQGVRNNEYVLRRAQVIHAYFLNGEILSYIQDNPFEATIDSVGPVWGVIGGGLLFTFTTPALGERIRLDPEYSLPSERSERVEKRIEMHLIQSVIDQFNRRLRQAI